MKATRQAFRLVWTFAWFASVCKSRQTLSESSGSGSSCWRAAPAMAILTNSQAVRG